jgi:Do/DeqQ family serine protease
MGAGSGVIISEDGYIVTNNHVVEDANKVSVTLNDKRSYKATVVGTDPTTDLALIKIEENNLPYIVYGNSDDVRIGEWVLAVGNPFNLTSTVTAGIVSAKARNINILGPDRQLGSAIESFIQTDAAVNRGNSGGALVNTRGELIGINAAIASGTGYYAGYSFAIPVNIVKKVATDLVQYGEIQRAFIGVTIGELNSELAEELGLDEIKGVYVNGVSDPGAAMEAGIESGDVILAIDGHEVNSMSELLGYIGQHRPGDKVEVRVNHNGDIENYDLVLRNRNGNTEIVEKSESTINNRLGIKLEEASRNQLSEYNSNNGVMIVELDPNGIAARKGIREGFLITRIDKRDVRTIEDVNAIVDNAEGGILIEGKYSGGSRVFYGFGL